LFLESISADVSFLERKMAQPFSWFRPGFKLVTANLEWNIQVPFLQNSEGNGERLKSLRFIPKELSGDQ
jgi:hypothetical protein